MIEAPVCRDITVEALERYLRAPKTRSARLLRPGGQSVVPHPVVRCYERGSGPGAVPGRDRNLGRHRLSAKGVERRSLPVAIGIRELRKPLRPPLRKRAWGDVLTPTRYCMDARAQPSAPLPVRALTCSSPEAPLSRFLR